MYPRAAAYIISVKQSTYCQFGEVIRARSRTGGGGGGAGRGEEDKEEEEEKRKSQRRLQGKGEA